MPSFCSVMGCANRAERDQVRFFKIPKAYKNRGERLDSLSKERRLRWVKCLKRGALSETFLNNARICETHFVSGEPAKLEDTDNPDWVPSVNLGYVTIQERGVHSLQRHIRAVKRNAKRLIVEEKVNVDTPDPEPRAGPSTEVFEQLEDIKVQYRRRLQHLEQFPSRTAERLHGCILPLSPRCKYNDHKTQIYEITMPGQTCAVSSCKNNRLTLKKQGVNLTFHRIPSAGDRIRDAWIRCCKRLGNKFNPDTSAICSLHFSEEDYERDLQNELLGLPLRRILKKTAVPSLHLGFGAETRLEIPIESQRRAKRATRKMNNHSENSLSMRTSVSNPDTSQLLGFGATADSSLPDTILPDTSAPSLNASSSPSDSYKKKYENLLKKYNVLKSHSEKQIRRLNAMIRHYEEKCDRQSLDKYSNK